MHNSYAVASLCIEPTSRLHLHITIALMCLSAWPHNVSAVSCCCSRWTSMSLTRIHCTCIMLQPLILAMVTSWLQIGWSCKRQLRQDRGRNLHHHRGCVWHCQRACPCCCESQGRQGPCQEGLFQQSPFCQEQPFSRPEVMEQVCVTKLASSTVLSCRLPVPYHHYV